ncbi:MAG: C40 family peptidase [Snodgrassella sp.]|nr:C40 family peptidase [Snodgrassella sp.]
MKKVMKLVASCLCTNFFCMAPVMAAPEGLDTDALDRLIRERTSKPVVRTGDDASDLIMNAMGLLGVAYHFGGNSPTKGLDCSGFMQYIFRRSMGITLPRNSRQMATVGEPVSRANMQPGDLVFFNPKGGGISHVGMYIGNGRMIHAPRTGKNIEITNIEQGYWARAFVTARRVKH